MDGDLRRTYRELDDAVNRAANALAERGLVKGDRLALLGHNSYGFVVTYFACARLGLICVPVNYMLGAGEVGYILEHSGASAMVAEDALVPLAEAGIDAAAAQIAVRGVIGDDRPGWEPASGLDDPRRGRRAGRRPRRRRPGRAALHERDRVAAQGHVLTSRSLIAQHTSCFVDGEMTPDDVEVHALPLFHSAQLHCFFTPSIHLGAVNVLLAKAEPAAMLAAVEAERDEAVLPADRVDRAHEPPGLRPPRPRRCARATTAPRSCRSRCWPNSASGCPASGCSTSTADRDVAGGDRAAARGPGPQAGRPAARRSASDWSSTRTATPSRPARSADRAPLTAGDARLLERPRQDRRDVPRRLAAHGDLGILDTDGYLYVVDRMKDMIKSGGENVASREVEEVIHAQPWPAARDPAPALDRGGRRRRRAARRGGRRARGDHRVLPRAPRRLQDPEVRRRRRRAAQNPSGKILKRELHTIHAGLAA